MVLAIDVGGTKTLLAVFTQDGDLKQSVKFPTPPDYNDFLLELAKNVDSLTTNKFMICVTALPGRINRSRGIAISFGNLTWSNLPIVDNLEKIIGCKVLIENDANLAGLSEANEVQAKKYNKVIYITVSTGIGCGIVVGGKLDPEELDAEVGHMLLEYGDKLQRWEEFASGKAIVARTGKRAAEIPAGDPLWYSIARNIAIGLINVVATQTPDCIVIGGGVGSHFAKFEEHLKEEMRLYEDKMLRVPPILPAVRAEEAVIYGAYLMAKQN